MKIRVLYIVFIGIFFYSSAVFPQMVSIQGGTFQMGDNGGEADEAPVHEVIVSPYKIDMYEVSYASYDSCVKSGGCTPAHYDDGKCLMWTSSGIRRVRVPLKYRSPEFPVICVSWYQAWQYCRYKGKKLPTEAQWEKAALAGYNNTYSWGNEVPNSSHCVSASKNRPVKSGSFKPNAWGIFDMTGNVWEWTYDRYERDYYKLSEKREPHGPPVGRFRVIRGGGWYSGAKQLRIRNRQWFAPDRGEVSIGIRCTK
jgi:formylglycine-generating enzyme required for sulfatase activity